MLSLEDRTMPEDFEKYEEENPSPYKCVTLGRQE